MHYINIHMHLHNADDVTIICPGIRGLNKMFEIGNQIIFILMPEKQFVLNLMTKKEHEQSLLKLTWTYNVRHIGDFVCRVYLQI